MTDFVVQIKIIEHQSLYEVKCCLKYLGKDEIYIRLINKYLEMYDFCLFNLVLTIFKDFTTFYKTTSLGKEIIFKVNGMLNTFFNTTFEFYNLFTYPESQKLKGFGTVILCLILNKLLKMGIISENSLIGLEAFGEYPGKGIEGLLNYYDNLGFNLLPELIENNDTIIMVGKIKNIIISCSAKVKNKIFNFKVEEEYEKKE